MGIERFIDLCTIGKHLSEKHRTRIEYVFGDVGDLLSHIPYKTNRSKIHISIRKVFINQNILGKLLDGVVVDITTINLGDAILCCK